MVTWSVGAATREASSPCLIISGTNFWSLSIKTFVWTSKPLVLKSVLKIIKKEVEVYTSNWNEWSKIFRNHPWVSNSIIHFFSHKIYIMLGDRCYLHLVINKSYFKNEGKTWKSNLHQTACFYTDVNFWRFQERPTQTWQEGELLFRKTNIKLHLHFFSLVLK